MRSITWTVMLAVFGFLFLGLNSFGVAPAPVRQSLEEEQKNLIRVDEKSDWVTEGISIEQDGKKRKIIPHIFLTKGLHGIARPYKGDKEFLEKSAASGNLWIGIYEVSGGSESGITYYRLEEKEDKRYIVIWDHQKAEEVKFTYELSGDSLTLKGGRAIEWGKIQLDLAKEYKRHKSEAPPK